MNKILLTLSIVVGMAGQTFAQDNLAWANAIGDAGDDAARISFVDASGNTYIGGNFAGTVDFNPGAATNAFTSVGGLDAFVAKYDASGNHVWSKAFGGTGAGAPATIDDYVYGIHVDAAGNVYATGFFQNTVDFNPANPGVDVLTSVGLGDMFIIKYDVSGNFQWVKQIGGVNQQIGYSIKLDATGNIYVCGAFVGAADFDPDPSATATLTAFSTAYDGFMAKYDNNGNYVWANKFGSTTSNATDNFWNLDIDLFGTIYVIGYFSATTDFNPDPTVTANITITTLDMVVAQYNANGAYIRAFRIGGAGADFGRCIKVDNQGSFYITGYYNSSSIDFDPGAGATTLASSNNDGFVAKYDTTGVFNWVRRLGGSGNDHAWQIDVDVMSNVYVTGYYYSSTFNIFNDAGTGSIGNITNPNGATSGTNNTSDGFLIKYNNAGVYQYANRIGTTSAGASNDAGYCISTTATVDDIYIGGAFSNTVDFDFSAATASRTSLGGTDIYHAKYLAAPLPVRMSPLYGKLTNGYAALQWETYMEAENKGFGIERSDDGKLFTEISFMDVGEDRNVHGAKYDFTDPEALSHDVYYRVRQQDISGATSYTNSVLIKHTNALADAYLYPNPVTNTLYLSIPTQAVLQPLSIKVYDMSGRVVLEETHTGHTGLLKINTSQLCTGVYYLLADAGGEIIKLSFTK